MRRAALLSLAAFAGCIGCHERARVPIADTFGPTPALVEPKKTTIPTVRVAKAVGWPEGRKPVPYPGSTVDAFARGLEHPRWLLVLPTGDVLVAETAAPPQPDDDDSLKGKAMHAVMKTTGSKVPSANRISLLRDADGDGVAETRTAFLEGLRSPFGMALVGDRLFVANTDSVVSYPYRGETRITAAETMVAPLPAGPINHHWTKNIIASPDGSRLYVSVGSNSNVAENGIEKERGRAAIHEIDLVSGRMREFATGLRNPVGMAWEPQTGALWVAVNERDEIGSDLVPDYMTAVRDGAFYGWPYCWFGSHVDDRVKPPRPDLVAKAVVPDYALGAHTASLGLAWSGANDLPEGLAHGMFVGQHGSWNREPMSGYQVIFVPFRGGRPAGDPVVVLSGFLGKDGDEAYGRPVGVAIDTRGALLVADDVGNTVWRVHR